MARIARSRRERPRPRRRAGFLGHRGRRAVPGLADRRVGRQGPAATALAWGGNGYGQLGNGAPRTVPCRSRWTCPPASRSPPSPQAAYFNLALRPTAASWPGATIRRGAGGRQQHGQFPAVPVLRLPPGTSVTAVSAGAAYGLALTSHGGVLAWGENAVRATGGRRPRSVPRRSRWTCPRAPASPPSPPAKIQPGVDVRRRRPGLGRRVRSGTAAAPRTVPRRSRLDLPPGTRVTAVSAGTSSLALTSGGGVLAWGDNGDGELGDGAPAVSSAPVAVGLPAGTRVTAVSAGDGYRLALTPDGSVLAWGSGGELGTAAAPRTVPTPVPVTCPGHPRHRHRRRRRSSLALTSDGRVLAWGLNFSGELGDGSTINSSTPVPVDLPPGIRVVAIAVGGDDSLAVAVLDVMPAPARPPEVPVTGQAARRYDPGKEGLNRNAFVLSWRVPSPGEQTLDVPDGLGVVLVQHRVDTRLPRSFHARLVVVEEHHLGRSRPRGARRRGRRSWGRACSGRIRGSR